MTTLKYCGRLNWFVYILAFIFTIACEGGESNGTDDSIDEKKSLEGTASTDNCDVTQLFAPFPFGEDGDNPIVEIKYDPSSGDYYFSTSFDLYILSAGSDAPRLLAERPMLLGGQFWLQEDTILLPGGFGAPSNRTEEHAVLYSMPRKGGELSLQVSFSMDDDSEWANDVVDQSVKVVDEYVYWITRKVKRSMTVETQYVLSRTLWSNPAEPEEIYRSNQDLSSIIVGGGYLFFKEKLPTEDTGELFNAKSQQRIVDLSTVEVLAMNSEQRYGGSVVKADDRSLLVTCTETDHLDRFGTWYMSPDGSEKIKLEDVLIFSVGGASAVSRDGVWAMRCTGRESGTRNELHVYTFSPENGLKDIGCFNADYSTGAIEIAGDQVVLGNRYDDSGTLITFTQ